MLNYDVLLVRSGICALYEIEGLLVAELGAAGVHGEMRRSSTPEHHRKRLTLPSIHCRLDLQGYTPTVNATCDNHS